MKTIRGTVTHNGTEIALDNGYYTCERVGGCRTAEERAAAMEPRVWEWEANRDRCINAIAGTPCAFCRHAAIRTTPPASSPSPPGARRWWQRSG